MATASIGSLPTAAVEYEYDVFLSYHSDDLSLVEPIAADLTAAGLKVWWDRDPRCMPAGAKWMVEMESGIRRSRATIACIGPGIQGYWQQEEYMLALNIQRERNNLVIPVLLPGAEFNKVPGFLSMRSCTNFSAGLPNVTEFDRLVLSIRSAAPVKRSPPQPQPGLKKDVAAAMRELWKFLGRDNLTFFLGSDIAVSPTRDCDIALKLLVELEIVSAPVSMLPPVDVAALYYAASQRDPVLEDTIVGLLQGRRAETSGVHERLANLLPSVMSYPRARGREQHRQLIVNLSLDTCLERALVKRRVKFVRIAARRTGTTFRVNDYRFQALLADGNVIGPDGVRYPLNTAEAQDNFIRECGENELSGDDVVKTYLGTDALSTPILFKPRGSEDVGDCAHSSVHLFDVARLLSVEVKLLKSISTIVENTGSVFFGLRFIGPELRLCWESLLRDKSSYPRYLFQPEPQCDSDDCFERSEAKIWDEIKACAQERSLRIVECPPEEAIDLLAGMLENAP